MQPPPRKLAIGWAAAWIAVALLTATVIGPWRDLYASMGVELPWITTYAVIAGDALRGPFGWLALNTLILVGVVPLRIGVGRAAYRRWLWLGIAQALLAALLLWAALEVPLLGLQEGLTIEADGSQTSMQTRPFDYHSVVARSALFTAPAMLVVGFLQVAAWVAIMVSVHAVPRARVQQEALRAIVLAVLPGVGLAFGTYLLVEDLRAGPSTGLLVSPPLAAAGTALLGVYGAALWCRVRRPAA